MKRAPLLMMAVLLAGCATQDRLTTADTRSENVGHQRLRPDAGGGTGQIQPYALAASEGYRMPQLHTAPDPVVGERDPRTSLPPTTVCLQVVVDAQGSVERSIPLTDRSECSAGEAPENAPLLQAAQEAVAMWKYSSAAVCHFAAGKVPADRGDCRSAERIEPVPVSLLYAFTFEVVKGQQTVRMQGK
ncbi:TPA: hypothetical protein UM521_001159 [Stenotrophomonas maltophilia]|uniref:hypothetical protein n=1 Tax=Stenotrophomonas maltophilia TaxID=40324 RepID=UPI00066B8746|nr:hypothetical protein [Stenotrophomonas maltophilia]MBH1465919.1 hypothetical protein [Stenotrophomonas maltophilia]MBH1615370.1 hypothetical protein [Stenotrophomonas maltophilia]MBN5079250.1 hypothetical protein [Stenotrophomonas maltophilia]MBN5168460.1 hypothetical protein [Stenotrophomonas maltophilia]MDZ5791964.1 hypothetical protein [Stenotrophomonas maltophilia]